jgi:folate-binding protein YgfZ
MSAFQAPIDRDVIEAAGPDAESFLQGQLSQDVAALGEGQSAYSLLLQPQGKVDAWLRVTRTGTHSFLLDVEGGWAPAVLARLNRFKLRTRCELTPLDGWACWAVRGLTVAADVVPAGARVLDAAWPGLEGGDVLGPGIGPLDGVPHGDAMRYGTARILAGIPAMGSELDEHTIPAEAGAWLIEHSVSFTKGCYTGQELVARVDSRGSNTPRKLRLVRASAGGALRGLAPGTPLRVGDADAGALTSVAGDGSVALGYVKRAVDVPTAGTAGDAAVQIEALPHDR